MRGYAEFQKVKNELRQKRLVSCFSYFSKMRTKLRIEKAIVIQRWFRRHSRLQETEIKIRRKMSSAKKIKITTKIKHKNVFVACFTQSRLLQNITYHRWWLYQNQ